MGSTRTSRRSPDSTPDSLAAAPPSPAPHHDHSFTLQAIMDLQKTVTALTVSVEAMKQSVDDTRSKVSKFEKILYAASVVLLITLAGGGWILNTVKDFAMLHYRTTLEAQSRMPQQAPPATAPVR